MQVKQDLDLIRNVVDGIDNDALKELEKLIQSDEKMQEDIKKEKENFFNQFKESGMTRQSLHESIIKSLDESIENAENSGNHLSKIKLMSTKKEYENSFTLDSFKESLRKIPMVKTYNYSNSLKSARSKLALSKKYKFREIRDLNDILQKFLPDQYKDYSETFLNNFYEFINKNKLSVHSVFIAQLINNIRSLAIVQNTEGDNSTLFFFRNLVETMAIMKGEQNTVQIDNDYFNQFFKKVEEKEE
jgi:hypothetical protein